jgi:hypothetical protein
LFICDPKIFFDFFGFLNISKGENISYIKEFEGPKLDYDKGDK